MSSKMPSKVVFVGNIPYGLSEEQISEIFSSAGRVLNFRLVYDKETGRPKGFGFAEYPDIDSAASAVRNLNDHEIMGRKLRVDFSNDGGDDDNTANQSSQPSYQSSNGALPPPSTATGPLVPPSSNSALPPLPPGKDLPPGVSCTDAISRTLHTLPPTQLLDILREMKTMATNEPERATELLARSPQLSYAIFQALLVMGLVSPDAINSVVENSPQPTQAQPAGYPSTTSPAPAVAAPPGNGVAYQDPEALMQMVMDLPQETIDQLPENERNEIMRLRAGYVAQRR